MWGGSGSPSDFRQRNFPSILSHMKAAHSIYYIGKEVAICIHYFSLWCDQWSQKQLKKVRVYFKEIQSISEGKTRQEHDEPVGRSAIRKQREVNEVAQLTFSLYSVWNPYLRDDANHIQGGSSVWKHPYSCSQRSVPVIIPNPVKLSVKIYL